MPDWVPFRPTPQDLARLAQDVAPIVRIQRDLRERHPQIAVPDRVAHQYQIAGGRVELTISDNPPAPLAGIGLFQPGAVHIGIGRVSTGLGCPHLETDPDFLGLMLAFRTERGRRVDLLAINHLAAPTDTHLEFMRLLEATAEGAGAEPPFGSGLGELDLLDLAASNLAVVRSLIGSMGLKRGGGTALHVLAQTLRTARSSTAYQTYWSGILEAGGQAGRIAIVPAADENQLRDLSPGERHLSDEWRVRQAAGPIVFDLNWLPFIDASATPLDDLTEAWEERPEPVGRVTFPKSDGTGDEARRWSALAAEMGANPGNWQHDAADSISEPATEFTCARKLAYRLSQDGRGALPEDLYADVFRAGVISDALAAELHRRRQAKAQADHLDMAP